MKGVLEFPLIKTKLMTPAVRENLVHRQNLVDTIETGIQQGFILISSPPGYGKTTLVADWASQTRSPIGWLSLDPNDNDLTTFCRYLAALCKKLVPELEFAEVTYSIEGRPMLALKSIMIALINACAEMDTEATIILDDYHLIDNRQIHEGVAFLLEHFPKGLRFILITRRDPPFSLARLRANGKILEIRSADLEFSIDQVRTFLAQIHLLIPEESEVRQLYDTTEGWVTGLQLLSLILKNPRKLPATGLTLSSETSLTIEYMIDEVLSHQPPRVHEFLLRTSILENLNSSLCSYVLNNATPAPECQEYLETLYHTNQFISPLDDQDHWFRYHSLFSGALQHLLKERYADEIPTLYNRASEWCEQHGFFEEALNYAEKADNPKRIVSLLEKYAINAVMQNRGLEIIGSIRRIDKSILGSSPWLSLIYSWRCLFSFELEVGKIWLEKACELGETTGTSAVPKSLENIFWGLIALEQSILKAADGENEAAMAHAKQAASLLPPENDFSHSFALLNQAITLTIDAETDQAIRILDETIRISQRAGNWFVMLFARCSLGSLYVSCGKLNAAMLLFNQTKSFFAATPGQFSTFEELIDKELGSIYLARNQLAEAEVYFQKCLKNGKSDYMLNNFDTHIRLAYFYQCKGDPLNAKAEFDRARELCSQSQSFLDDVILNLNEGKWALLKGQVFTAQKILQNIELVQQEPPEGITEKQTGQPIKYPKALRINAQLVSVRLDLIQGQAANSDDKLKQAKEKLNQIIPDLTARNLIERLIEALILSAFVAQELDDPDQMMAALESALRFAEPESFRQVFINEGIPMSRALLQYLNLRKQRESTEPLPTREFISDLLFRLSGKEDHTPDEHAFSEKQEEENLFLTDLLTVRENEVIRLVAKGRSNSEIAGDLFISVNTVKRHLNNAYLKLGVSTRTQAIRVARNQGLIN